MSKKSIRYRPDYLCVWNSITRDNFYKNKQLAKTKLITDIKEDNYMFNLNSYLHLSLYDILDIVNQLLVANAIDFSQSSYCLDCFCSLEWLDNFSQYSKVEYKSETNKVIPNDNDDKEEFLTEEELSSMYSTESSDNVIQYSRDKKRFIVTCNNPNLDNILSDISKENNKPTYSALEIVYQNSIWVYKKICITHDIKNILSLI